MISQAALDPELEVDPAVVDRPGAVDAEQQPVGGVGDQLVQAALAGLQVHVGHADERHAAPAVGPHGLARPTAGLGRRLPAGQEPGDHAPVTSGTRWAGTLVVEGEGPEPAGVVASAATDMAGEP